MNRNIAIRRCVDALMTAALLLLMSYSLIGEAVHEWLGTGMGLLFLLHLVLNRKWLQGLGSGRYAPYRVLQTALAALCLLAMLGLLFSGVLLSQCLFPALRIRGLTGAARRLHMACSFWGFVLMSVHLGFHWGMVLPMGRLPPVLARLLRALGWLTAAYGVYAFWKRGFPDYLLLRNHFLFLDYEEPVLCFFFDYLAVMGLFIFCGRCGAKLFQNIKRSRDHE